jgi:uncharacterized protein YjiS (DUF1127 family)
MYKTRSASHTQTQLGRVSMAQIHSAIHLAAGRRVARDIAKLSPHQLRDIGLPETLPEDGPHHQRE